MVSYWNAFLECSYANSAFLDWFGKSIATEVRKLNLADLLGASLIAFEPHLHAVLSGNEVDFEMEVDPKKSGAVKRAIFRLVPDFSGEEVRGFMITGVEISREGPGAAVSPAVTGDLIGTADSIVVNGISRKLQEYSERLIELLGAQLENGDSGNARFSVEFMIDAESQMSITQVGEASFSSEINLYDCISRVVTRLDDEFRAASCSVRVRVSPFIYVHANPIYLESIIFSFLGNAIVTRSANRAAVVELTSMVSGDETILSIKDNGNGIDLNAFLGRSEMLLADDDKQVAPMSLHVARQQVYAMGGYIGVESDPEKGTWFRIYFKTKLRS
ncbi:MAG: hypothetical protein KF744_09495 [Taibaiella sp.]|nr:hypothetical protein [Taibaiella sp.]